MCGSPHSAEFLLVPLVFVCETLGSVRKRAAAGGLLERVELQREVLLVGGDARVEDPGRAERLARAIAGRGAFRRFKDELARWPGELERWYAMSEERHRGRARSWLTAAGYRVLPVARGDP
jgi:hypothetical protein